MMKKTIILILLAISVTALTFATEPVAGNCDRPACGGGSDNCCTDVNGNLFYTKAASES